MMRSRRSSSIEIYCQLCGVSFKINRFRTRSEPRHAAWDSTMCWGDEWGFPFGSNYYNCPTESKESCVAVDRFHSLPVTLGTSTVGLPTPSQFDTEFSPLSVSYERNVQSYEHIAGPSCQQLVGYNGHNISVEEMLDCTTVQCVYAKDDNWIPNGEDMYFETDSKYYLSGLSDHSSMEGWEQIFAPIRHEKVQGNIANDNNLWLESEEQQRKFGVAFHPACFELFRIVSEQIFGIVNINGLVELRNASCTSFTKIFCDWGEVVEDCREQSWQHLPGTEYLVSNPVFIPGFRDICDNALQTGGDFNVQQSAFSQREGHQNQSVSADPFLKLPSELVQNVVSYLNPKEIAAIRLASRAFEHLPISLWYRLICTDMPFIYEAWRDDVTPYTWASQDVNLLQNLRKEAEEWESQREKKARELDHDPELEAKFLATEPKIPPWHTESNIKKLKEKSLRIKKRLQPIALPRDKTNWYQLYSDVVRHWKDLKGLQNRERMWETLFDICGSIGENGGRGSEGNEDNAVDRA